jgi:hypothetical protein
VQRFSRNRIIHSKKYPLVGSDLVSDRAVQSVDLLTRIGSYRIADYFSRK